MLVALSLLATATVPIRMWMHTRIGHTHVYTTPMSKAELNAGQDQIPHPKLASYPLVASFGTKRRATFS